MRDETFQEDPPRAKPEGDGETEGAAEDPGANRSKALDTALEEWCQLQEEEDALLEKHIAPVRDKKNKVKARAKSDLEIPTKAFTARATLRMIERKGEDEVVLAVNELFRATPVGNTLDLVALADRVAKKKADKAAATTKKATEVTATAAEL